MLRIIKSVANTILKPFMRPLLNRMRIIVREEIDITKQHWVKYKPNGLLHALKTDCDYKFAADSQQNSSAKITEHMGTSKNP